MDNTTLQNHVNSITRGFARLVIATQNAARLFAEAVPNANTLLEITLRLYSASRYLDFPLTAYDAPMDADCSPSASTNTAYDEDKLQLYYYPDPKYIEPPVNRTFPSVPTVLKMISGYLDHLDKDKSYYEPPVQMRYLESEGDVDDVTFHELMFPVVSVAQDVLEMYYDTQKRPHQSRGHLEVRAKYTPVREFSQVDHVILFVLPKQRERSRADEEVIVFVEDKRASSIRLTEWSNFSTESYMAPASPKVGTNLAVMIPQVRKYVYQHRVKYCMLHDHKNPICMIWDDCDGTNRRAGNYAHRCHYWLPSETEQSRPTARRSLFLLIILSLIDKGIAFV